MNNEIKPHITYLSTAIGMTSLIGVMGDAPHPWGNYFSLYDGPRIVNFWAENLEAADERFSLGGKVRVRVYQDGVYQYGLIDDNRIPTEWYYDKLCFTGTRSPSLDVIKDMYNYIGDPNNEIERYVDPASYYKKRGANYNPKTGIVSYTVTAPSRTLSEKWTVEEITDSDTYGESVMEDLVAALIKDMTR